MIPNYQVDKFGVIHQVEFEPIAYDVEYMSYYENLSDRTIKLGYQRMGWVLGTLKQIPERVLEIGYGTGTFVEAAKVTGVPYCAGYDISRYPLPEGVEFVDWEQALQQEWDLVAMFDVLEHIPDLSFLHRLKTKFLAVAVPFCRWRELGDEWFQNWRMLLPNEHLHHFDRESLVDFLAHCGFTCMDTNTFEDGIRLRQDENGPNILSGFFQKA